MEVNHWPSGTPNKGLKLTSGPDTVTSVHESPAKRGKMTTASDLLGYEGKRVLVVGGATGMGAAAAQIAKSLGAHVTVMDFAAVDYDADKVISLDLSDQDSIDRAVDELDGPVDSLFSAAGVADGPKLMQVNFIGHRHLIERLFANDLLNQGAAICFISSVAGMGWENDLELVQDFLATPDYKSAHDWCQEREAQGFIHYGFSKQAINGYVAWQGYHFLEEGRADQRGLPRPDRHSAGPRERRSVADLRPGLPRRHRQRDTDARGHRQGDDHAQQRRLGVDQRHHAERRPGARHVVDHRLLGPRQGDHGPDHRPGPIGLSALLSRA